MKIAGKNLNNNQAMDFALMRVYGIGRTRAIYIMQQLNITLGTKVKDITDEQFAQINALIEKKFQVENDLKRTESLNKKKKIDINCYSGKRLRDKLPAHGQRTKTNSKTARKGK